MRWPLSVDRRAGARGRIRMGTARAARGGGACNLPEPRHEPFAGLRRLSFLDWEVLDRAAAPGASHQTHAGRGCGRSAWKGGWPSGGEAPAGGRGVSPCAARPRRSGRGRPGAPRQTKFSRAIPATRWKPASASKVCCATSADCGVELGHHQIQPAAPGIGLRRRMHQLRGQRRIEAGQHLGIQGPAADALGVVPLAQHIDRAVGRVASEGRLVVAVQRGVGGRLVMQPDLEVEPGRQADGRSVVRHSKPPRPPRPPPPSRSPAAAQRGEAGVGGQGGLPGPEQVAHRDAGLHRAAAAAGSVAAALWPWSRSLASLLHKDAACPQRLQFFR